MRVAILAHEQFPSRAKTALGILRYSDHEVVAVLDRDRTGERVSDHVSDVQDAPIVASMADVSDVDALIIGIAPIGGGFEESWRSDVRTAIERGCDIISGLHYFLIEDDEFASLADEYDVTLHDVRRPPADLTVSSGAVRDLDVSVTLTVGTDCSVGKMTTTMELASGIPEAGVVPTGQTGIMIEGWGIAVDRVISDFAAGAVERMIDQQADEHDRVIVEGQGSITHPAYSGVTVSILHGSMPDGIVLCHEAGREAVHGYESFALPDLPEAARLYEELGSQVSPTEVVGVSLNTRELESDAASAAIEEVEAELGVPCTDPVRFDPSPLVEVLP